MATIVEMINPLTGLPEQVDKLDHTAQEIDDAVGRSLPGAAIDASIQAKPNPNLLDNWYFGNPVNQRGGYVVPPGTTYYYSSSDTVAGTTSAYYAVKFVDTNGNATFAIDGTDYWCVGKGARGYIGEVYGIDRWIAQWTSYGVTLIEDGCVSIYRTDSYSHLIQRIADDLGGQTVTFSALCKGNCGINLIESGSDWAFKSHIASRGNTASNDYTLFTVTGVVPQGCKNLLAELTSAQGVKSQFKAAKLELGTQQTLAHQDENGNWVLNEIPNYGEQLARCQRYFQTFATESLRPTNALDFRPVMRATPALSTITAGGKTLYTASADL